MTLDDISSISLDNMSETEENSDAIVHDNINTHEQFIQRVKTCSDIISMYVNSANHYIKQIHLHIEDLTKESLIEYKILTRNINEIKIEIGAYLEELQKVKTDNKVLKTIIILDQYCDIISYLKQNSYALHELEKEINYEEFGGNCELVDVLTSVDHKI